MEILQVARGHECSYISPVSFQKGGYRNRKLWKLQENKRLNLKYIGKTLMSNSKIKNFPRLSNRTPQKWFISATIKAVSMSDFFVSPSRSSTDNRQYQYPSSG